MNKVMSHKPHDFHEGNLPARLAKHLKEWDVVLRGELKRESYASEYTAILELIFRLIIKEYPNVKSFEHIKQEQVAYFNLYFKRLADKDVISVRTRAGYKRKLKRFAEYVLSYNKSKNDILPFIAKVNVPKYKKPECTYSLNQVKQLIQHFDGGSICQIRNQTFFRLTYNYGFRYEACAMLRLSDIDWKKKTITPSVHKSINAQGDEFILTSEMEKMLRQYIDEVRPKVIGSGRRGPKPKVENDFPDDLLFCTSSGRPLDNKYIDTQIKKAGLSAGINQKVKCHGLRHSIATHLQEAGVDILVIKTLLQHEDIKSTQVYFTLNRIKTLQAIETYQEYSQKVINGTLTGTTTLSQFEGATSFTGHIPEAKVSINEVVKSTMPNELKSRTHINSTLDRFRRKNEARSKSSLSNRIAEGDRAFMEMAQVRSELQGNSIPQATDTQSTKEKGASSRAKKGFRDT